MCALVLTLSVFTACNSAQPTGTDNGGSDVIDADGGDTLADFDWIKFEMPEGYENAKESDSYVTIQKTGDSDYMLKFFSSYIFEGETMESIVEEEGSDDYYTPGESFELGGYKWYTIHFTFNDKESSKFYTQIADKHYLQITAFGLTEDSDEVKTVLGSVVIDQAQFED